MISKFGFRERLKLQVLSESDFLKFDNLTVISDVFLNEPSIDKNFHQKNFISTPHIAGHTKSSRFDMTKMSLEKLIKFFFNKKLNDSLVKKPYKKKRFCVCNKKRKSYCTVSW